MYHNNVTNLIHFHFHNHFIVSSSSTCFGRPVSIFSRHYTSSFRCELRALVAFGWVQVVRRQSSHNHYYYVLSSLRYWDISRFHLQKLNELFLLLHTRREMVTFHSSTAKLHILFVSASQDITLMTFTKLAAVSLRM
jgi:hypothetical protein